MSKVRMNFVVTNADGTEHNDFSWGLANLNAERIGEIKDYMEKMESHVKDGGNAGDLTVTMSASVDGVAATPRVFKVSADHLDKVEDKMLQHLQKLRENEKARKGKGAGKP